MSRHLGNHSFDGDGLAEEALCLNRFSISLPQSPPSAKAITPPSFGLLDLLAYVIIALT